MAAAIFFFVLVPDQDFQCFWRIRDLRLEREALRGETRLRHGVAARSTRAKSATSHVCCSDDEPVPAYEHSEIRCIGPMSADHQRLESDPLALCGIGWRRL